jgi:hypothetical protein
MTVVVIGLLVLAALALGLRTASVLISPRVHPMVRFGVAALAGALMVMVALELSESFRVFGLGLGLLLSLAPVGLYDVTRWWLRWRNHRPPG